MVTTVVTAAAVEVPPQLVEGEVNLLELRRLHLEPGELVAQLARHVRLCDEQPLLQDHAEVVRRRRVA